MKWTYLSELDDDDDPPEFSSLLWSESDDSSSDTFCNLNLLLYTDGNMVPVTKWSNQPTVHHCSYYE